jgi:tetratricopeptide (TPR) repeat protein
LAPFLPYFTLNNAEIRQIDPISLYCSLVLVMNILLVGNINLSQALNWLGHRVVQADSYLPPGATEIDVGHICSQLPATARPDLLLLVESLGPRRLPLDLENLRLPRAFYALDPHLNLSWHLDYATSFDLIFTTQKNTLPAFRNTGRPAFWLPWAVDLRIICDHGLDRRFDLAFVGRLDPVNRRKRHFILETLKARFPVSIFGDRPDNTVDAWELGRIYNQTRIVVNEAIQGDLNLRVFEALAAGTLLLTEDIGDNLTALFTPGRHLATFGPADLLEKAEYFLRHEEKRRAIASEGCTLVRREHHILARARQLLNYLGEAEFVWQTADHLHLGRTFLNLVRRGLYPASLGLRRASHHLQEALRTQPQSATSHLLLGQVFLILGNLPEGLTAYHRAVACDPQDFHLQILLGHLYSHMENLAAASASYYCGLDLSGLAPTALGYELQNLIHRGERGPAFFTALGRLYEKRGFTFEVGFPLASEEFFFQSALEYYHRALTLDPDHLPALEALGDLLFRLGFPSEAISYLEKCVALAPHQPEYHWRLGLAQINGYQSLEGLENLLLAQDYEPHRPCKPCCRNSLRSLYVCILESLALGFLYRRLAL